MCLRFDSMKKPRPINKGLIRRALSARVQSLPRSNPYGVATGSITGTENSVSSLSRMCSSTQESSDDRTNRSRGKNPLTASRSRAHKERANNSRDGRVVAYEISSARSSPPTKR